MHIGDFSIWTVLNHHKDVGLGLDISNLQESLSQGDGNIDIFMTLSKPHGLDNQEEMANIIHALLVSVFILYSVSRVRLLHFPF